MVVSFECSITKLPTQTGHTNSVERVRFFTKRMSTNSVYRRGARRYLSQGKRYFQSQTASAITGGGDAVSSNLQLATAAMAATFGLAHNLTDEDNKESSLAEKKDKIRQLEETTSHSYTSFDFEPGTVEDIQQIIAKCYVSPSQCSLGNNGSSFKWRVGGVGIENHYGHNNDTNSIKDMDDNQNEAAAVIGGNFPSLQAHILNDNNNKTNHQKFQINTDESIPFENDFFVGRVKLTLKPLKEEDDPGFGERVLGEDNRFDIHIQGRLKRLPRGTLYMGAEITEPVKMSPVGKGVSSVFLRVLSKVIGANMDYSFGGAKDGQLAHISFPLHTAMDHLVITKDKSDEQLPCLGQPLEEPEESIRSRKAMQDGQHIWNTKDTYSMSFSSTCVDVPTWRSVKPFDMNFSQFWGKSLLRLVIYEKGDRNEEKQQQNAQEEQSSSFDNKYLFALQLKFLGIPESHQNIENKEETDRHQHQVATRPRRTNPISVALS